MIWDKEKQKNKYNFIFQYEGQQPRLQATLRTTLVRSNTNWDVNFKKKEAPPHGKVIIQFQNLALRGQTKKEAKTNVNKTTLHAVAECSIPIPPPPNNKQTKKKDKKRFPKASRLPKHRPSIADHWLEPRDVKKCNFFEGLIADPKSIQDLPYSSAPPRAWRSRSATAAGLQDG